jgi:hypothetical protein
VKHVLVMQAIALIGELPNSDEVLKHLVVVAQKWDWPDRRYVPRRQARILKRHGLIKRFDFHGGVDMDAETRRIVIAAFQSWEHGTNFYETPFGHPPRLASSGPLV